VDFIDIEWGTYNLDLGLLENRLRYAARRNRLPKVVAPVHFAGNPVDMEFLDKLRMRYGFKVVEDAAHATGAKFQGEPVGSCRWSDLCVFSFHAVKIITTGEGGMITTNSSALYERLTRLRTHGITRDEKQRPASRRYPWYYEKLELGNHYRMTDIQAALGRSQLKKIRKFQNQRKKISDLYRKDLASLPVDLPRTTPGAESSWHLYPMCVKTLHSFRDSVLQALRKKGVEANLHYWPVPSLRYYNSQRKGGTSCPKAVEFAQKCISLPIFPGLSKSSQAKVLRSLRPLFS
jgi:dTDP-4-amino-4,6-dideoxygalactose transaminase